MSAWVTQDQWGFAWRGVDSDCVVDVSRIATISGRAIVGVQTLDSEGSEVIARGVHVIASKGGRSLRVFDAVSGKEMKVCE